MQALSINPHEFSSVFQIVKEDKATSGKIKISAVQRIMGRFSKKSSAKLSELIGQMKSIHDFVIENELSYEVVLDMKKNSKTLLANIAIMSDVLNTEVLKNFELDDPVFNEIVEKFQTINQIAVETHDQIKLYHEVYLAKQDFQSGRVISHEELLNECI